MKNALVGFRFTLNYAHKLIADLDDAELTQQPHPGMNHPAWILGHLALSADYIVLMLGGELDSSEEFVQKFGPGSTPIDDRSAYPKKSDLVANLDRLYAEAIKAVESADEADFQHEHGLGFLDEDYPTVADLVLHLLTVHPATHLGQLSAWRRTVGKGSVLGF